jgi:uncharacterized paraquat-inducible protein A
MIRVICPNCSKEIEVKNYKSVSKGKSQCSNCYKILALEPESFLHSTLVGFFPFLFFITAVYLMYHFHYASFGLFVFATCLCFFIAFIFDKLMERYELKYKLKVKED